MSVICVVCTPVVFLFTFYNLSFLLFCNRGVLFPLLGAIIVPRNQSLGRAREKGAMFTFTIFLLPRPPLFSSVPINPPLSSIVFYILNQTTFEHSIGKRFIGIWYYILNSIDSPLSSFHSFRSHLRMDLISNVL